jgi:phage terminase large subunit-like protein
MDMQCIPTALQRLPRHACAALLDQLPERQLRTLARDFPTWSHPGQLPPDGDWRTWLIMAGRGFGKTRAGAEWVLSLVRAHPVIRIALVAATVDEARRIMVEGPSGLLRLAKPNEIADWSPSQRLLTFAGGATAQLYSGASPESLRGPEHHFAWCDELAKWRHPEGTWNNLQLGLRMGAHPRCLVTTTPQAIPLLTRIIEAPDTVCTGGATQDNPHLPAAYISAMEAAYGGSRLGRQELQGELLTDVEGSLWPWALIERCRAEPPTSVRTVVAVDPPTSENGTCGIIVAALDHEGKAYVLADASVSGASPDGWARAVAGAAERWDADRVIAEKNQGGDMVKSVLRAASATLPVELVQASQSKGARAEPVAAQFENGLAFFVGHFPELEAQLNGLTPAGGHRGPSPDRADACVWALWALLLKPKAPEPHIRSL